MAATIEHEFRGPRRRLVELLHDQGIRDLAVLNAIDKTPRHLFVPTGVRHRAYEDSALVAKGWASDRRVARQVIQRLRVETQLPEFADQQRLYHRRWNLFG